MLDQAQSRFRHWLQKVWQLRGGGLYAVGWAATFLYLEITSVIDAMAGADGVVDFITSQLVEFVLRFMGDSIVNMVYAFLWPLYVLQWHPPAGFIALGIAYFVFARFVKHHVTAWLFPDGEPTQKPSD